ncbi:hypothetical protein PCL_08072 [Purpureocillium lilacinum]|uniref:Uncharacterized protein n=1 Tax=Purpureocillium lilacinum TaxID=33203 RepID=A0A2U3EJR3_PURLI|nr:hypothetical protein Purlil1_3081 [Purpureocillium lilacinum]PWI74758.1 hypothetical protein PCL_08072 [Purpureocillium lilacinum]
MLRGVALRFTSGAVHWEAEGAQSQAQSVGEVSGARDPKALILDLSRTVVRDEAVGGRGTARWFLLGPCFFGEVVSQKEGRQGTASRAALGSKSLPPGLSLSRCAAPNELAASSRRKHEVTAVVFDGVGSRLHAVGVRPLGTAHPFVGVASCPPATLPSGRRRFVKTPSISY